MGQKSSKKLDSLAEQLRSKGTPVLDTAHDVWLAGLGALSIARKKGGKVAGKGSKMFERLVAEGQEFEKKVGKTVRSDARGAAERISGAADKARDQAKKVADKARNQANKAADKARDQAKKAATKLIPKRTGPVTLHLVPKDEEWTVRLEGSEEDLSLHSTKQSAVKAARGIARAQAPSHLVVHRADGTVQDTFSYS